MELCATHAIIFNYCRLIINWFGPRYHNSIIIWHIFNNLRHIARFFRFNRLMNTMMIPNVKRSNKNGRIVNKNIIEIESIYKIFFYRRKHDKHKSVEGKIDEHIENKMEVVPITDFSSLSWIMIYSLKRGNLDQ